MGLKYLHKLFGILWHRRFVYSLSFTYSIMSICFILWVIIQHHFYFIAQMSQLWPLGALSVALSVGCCTLLTHLHQCVLLMWFEHILNFLALQDAPGSSCMFPVPVPESGISPRSPGSFSWRMVLETKIWVVVVLVDTEIPVSFLILVLFHLSQFSLRISLLQCP